MDIKPHHSWLAACLLSIFGLIGCDNSKPLPAPQDLGSAGGAYGEIPTDILFSDVIESNREDEGAVSKLQFVDTEGDTVTLDQYKGNKNVLLVFTRGFSGQLCPYCTTQTSRLIANYDEFTRRDTEVLLVYPGSTSQLPLFQKASMEETKMDSFPFPVLLDENLTAVKLLGIESQLAFPSTFIIDKQGKVRLSYVGANPADRPSIKALLSQLDNMAE